MIHIAIHRDQQQQITRVTIQGHAEFDEYGKDIVCAAISAISIGMMNAIEKLLNVSITSNQSQPGWLDGQLPMISDQETSEKVQLLLEAMVMALSDVADEYPQYVTINHYETKG